MNLRFASLCAASALAYLLIACKDSATTPAAQAAGPRPSFATGSDTGGGGGGPGNQSHFVSSGTSDLSFAGGFEQHTTGVSTSASANGAGSVVGIVVSPGSSGNIGTNHNVTIDISH